MGNGPLKVVMNEPFCMIERPKNSSLEPSAGVKKILERRVPT
jgi:hypothetical protein